MQLNVKCVTKHVSAPRPFVRDRSDISHTLGVKPYGCAKAVEEIKCFRWNMTELRNFVCPNGHDADVKEPLSVFAFFVL